VGQYQKKQADIYIAEAKATLLTMAKKIKNDEEKARQDRLAVKPVQPVPASQPPDEAVMVVIEDEAVAEEEAEAAAEAKAPPNPGVDVTSHGGKSKKLYFKAVTMTEEQLVNFHSVYKFEAGVDAVAFLKMRINRGSLVDAFVGDAPWNILKVPVAQVRHHHPFPITRCLL
jgi:hypothetical protein